MRLELTRHEILSMLDLIFTAKVPSLSSLIEDRITILDKIAKLKLGKVILDKIADERKSLERELKK